MTRSQRIRFQLRGVRVLYVWFRGAEVPLGRVRAAKEAVQMALFEGWPRVG